MVAASGKSILGTEILRIESGGRIPLAARRSDFYRGSAG